MNKLAGGNLLACGHYQVVSNLRSRFAAAGRVQHPVFCIECDDWSDLLPEKQDDVEEKLQ